MIVFLIVLITWVPFLAVILLLFPESVPPPPVVQTPSSSMCCPKVFLYDPADILQRAQKLHQQGGSNFTLKLSDLDALNTDSVVMRNFSLSSIPPDRRMPLLTDVLRWLSNVPNRPITHADNLFPNNSNRQAFMFYTKDYVNTFHLRVAVSGCTVSDPTEADLFLVPFSIHTDHSFGIKSLHDEWDKLFDRITDFQELFVHLTPETARRHVLFASSFGHSQRSVGLWSAPYNDPKLRQVQRVALGSSYLIRKSYGPWLQKLVHTPRNVISAPFSTLIIYPRSLLNISAQKTILASSFLEFHGKAKELRLELSRLCTRSSECWTKEKLIAMRNETRMSKKQLVASFIEAKTRSTFCLEPEGDWPTRQSMIQDVLLTCIPVFFTNSYRYLWEDFWGNFIHDAAVELDGDAILRGDYNLFDKLRAIPQEEILRKQDIMRKHRHQLIYLHAYDFVHDGNNFRHKCSVDATNILLNKLVSRSKL